MSSFHFWFWLVASAAVIAFVSYLALALYVVVDAMSLLIG